MDEMNVDAINTRLELVERVQPLFLSPPVISVTPVFDDALQVCEVCTVIPTCILKLIRKARLSQAPFQFGQYAIWNLNFEGHDRLRVPINRKNRQQNHSGGHESNVAATHLRPP